jgi:LysR family transcriptional regulator, low CO2-responsive transcriptional regulator
MDTSSSAELRAFDATIRTGSMSAAAKLLGIRQPTISAHIACLERQFGVDLFVRDGRGLRATEMAHRLYEITNRIYRAEEDAALLLASVRSHYEGSLRICAIGPYNVVPMIAAFRAQYPLIRIAVAIGDSKRVVERVTTHQDDVGVLLHAVDSPTVHCVAYRHQPLVIFAPTSHPLARTPEISVHDLSGQEFVLRERGSQTRTVFEAGLATAGVRIRCAVEMGSREAVREAVAQGLGLGVVAQTAFVADQRLVPLNIRDLSLATHVHVIVLQERRADALVAGFLAIVDNARLRLPCQ